jgi:hypothetical protein
MVWRIEIQAKIWETLLQQKKKVWWHVPVSYCRKCKIGGSRSRPAWAKNETLFPKPRAKRAGSMAQVRMPA